MDTRTGVDAARFRSVLGHFCTGITVITTLEDDHPTGFACQSFAALSLDPPLVLFCPGVSSRSWPVIERVGRFCVNVLGAEQKDVSTAFGSPGGDKFDGVDWAVSPGGSPLLEGVLTWIDCTVDVVHRAGDHYVVTAAVTGLGSPSEERPLLFYRGGYTATEPPARPAPLRGTGDDLLTWPHPTDWV